MLRRVILITPVRGLVPHGIDPPDNVCSPAACVIPNSRSLVRGQARRYAEAGTRTGARCLSHTSPKRNSTCGLGNCIIAGGVPVVGVIIVATAGASVISIFIALSIPAPGGERRRVDGAVVY